MTSRYNFNIIARLLLTIAAALTAGWLLAQGELFMALLPLALLVILSINMVYFMHGVNRQITGFFEAIRNEDHSLAFPRNTGSKTLDKLSSHIDRINSQIRDIHLENRRQEQYFGALIEHVGTGILSFDKKGFVIHANSSLKQLLGMEQLTHLRQLDRIDAGLTAAVMNLRPYDEKLISFNGKNKVINLLVKASTFKSRDEPLTLVSMQDIKKELDEKEIDSWMKLIRVLTHEIMNSIAPVTSLSENLYSSFLREGNPVPAEEIDERMISDTIKGLRVINEQGQGLIRFVGSYRKLTRLPEPVMEKVVLKDLLERTIMLCQSDKLLNDISLSTDLPDDEIWLSIDEKLVSQVLINLIRNSAEALCGKPGGYIRISGGVNAAGKTEIRVADNGPGIPPELAEEIFIPFFTTRENGNGIGLSLSRQIMRLHNGTLKVSSLPRKETVFTMTFN